MLSRVLKISVDKIKQSDTTQATDISGLKTKVGTVPSGSGNDLQSQITALAARVGEVPSGSGNDLQSQITALTARVAALEPAGED